MKSDRVYFSHIRDACLRIVEYSAQGKDVFLRSPLLQDGIVRNLEIIGEAAKGISETARASHPEIPFRAMSGMRDKLIHQYFGVDLMLVWQVVESEIPLTCESRKPCSNDSRRKIDLPLRIDA